MIFGHRHRREAVAVQHRSIPFTAASITLVLWRCGCGEVTAQELAGRWTLGQVRGEQDLTVPEQVEGSVASA